jgi:hypothetical protein
MFSPTMVPGLLGLSYDVAAGQNERLMTGRSLTIMRGRYEAPSLLAARHPWREPSEENKPSLYALKEIYKLFTAGAGII